MAYYDLLAHLSPRNLTRTVGEILDLQQRLRIGHRVRATQDVTDPDSDSGAEDRVLLVPEGTEGTVMLAWTTPGVICWDNGQDLATPVEMLEHLGTDLRDGHPRERLLKETHFFDLPDGAEDWTPEQWEAFLAFPRDWDRPYRSPRAFRPSG
jgi:hypothetical protein